MNLSSSNQDVYPRMMVHAIGQGTRERRQTLNKLVSDSGIGSGGNGGGEGHEQGQKKNKKKERRTRKEQQQAAAEKTAAGKSIDQI